MEKPALGICMSFVGGVSVFLGVLIMVSRGMLVVAPAFTLDGFRNLLRTEQRVRVFGLCLLPPGALLIWCGYLEDSGLALVLLVIGWFVTPVALLALVIFPKAYLALIDQFLPADPATNYVGWRMIGALGFFIGCLFVGAGIRAF